MLSSFSAALASPSLSSQRQPIFTTALQQLFISCFLYTTIVRFSDIRYDWILIWQQYSCSPSPVPPICLHSLPSLPPPWSHLHQRGASWAEGSSHSDSLSKNIEISYLDISDISIWVIVICGLLYMCCISDNPWKYAKNCKNINLSKSLVASWRHWDEFFHRVQCPYRHRWSCCHSSLRGRTPCTNRMYHPLKSAQSWKVLKSYSKVASPPPRTTFCSIENLKDRLSRAFRQ